MSVRPPAARAVSALRVAPVSDEYSVTPSPSRCRRSTPGTARSSPSPAGSSIAVSLKCSSTRRAGGPSAMILPPSMIATRSQSSSASSM